MMLTDTRAILDQVQHAQDGDDLSQAIQFLQYLKSADQAEVFENLDDEGQVSLLCKFSTEDSAAILEYCESQ